MLKKIRIVAFALIPVIVAVNLAIWWLVRQDDPTAAGDATGPLVTNVSVGGPFTLVDHTGREVTEESYRGKFRLMYFGYTFCPDVCPTELGNLAVALDELGEDIDGVVPMFITIDPERDTPELLAEYVRLFHDNLIGLTGSRDQVDEVARNYRVFYRKVKDPDYTYYLMDHTSFTYLMGPDGELVRMFAYGTPPEKIAGAIRDALRQHDVVG
ncbi:MAG: SCO family protein [Alphaproteobacteria bacterium]